MTRVVTLAQENSLARPQPEWMRGVYAITPDWSDSVRLVAVTERILAAGCRLVQYRNKTALAGLRLTQATALRELTQAYAARLIVNDDLELALAVGADGVHLGVSDGNPATARRRLGTHRLLGVSCYQSLERARQAVAIGADYVAFGSFFPSPTKPKAAHAELALLRHARALGAPVCAIGGITAENAPTLLAAGADLLAVISALYAAPDPYAACRAFVQAFLTTVTTP